MLTWAEVQMVRRKKELAEADFAQFFQDEQVKEGRYQTACERSDMRVASGRLGAVLIGEVDKSSQYFLWCDACSKTAKARFDYQVSEAEFHEAETAYLARVAPRTIEQILEMTSDFDSSSDDDESEPEAV